MPFAANEQFVVHRRGRGVDSFTKRVGGDNFELFAVFDDDGRAAAAGEVDVAIGRDR